MQIRIALGAVLFMLVIAVVGYVIINEGLLPGQTGRMQKFDAQVLGRSIEAGALLFQNNCVGCHGVQGQGIPGVAPALNAADLFNGERLKKVGYSGKVDRLYPGHHRRRSARQDQSELSQPDAHLGPGVRRATARRSD